MNSGQTPPKKRGCFFYGCLTLIVLALVAVLLSYLGFRYVQRVVIEYTDTKPELIETVEVSPAQLEALEKRVDAFRQALKTQSLSQELRLSAEDINVLIANDPSLKDLRQKLFVLIDDDRIKGKVSIPLDNFGPLRLKGRYLNGVGTFKASLENGVLWVTLDDLQVKGKGLPPQFLTRFKKQNLARDAANDPDTAQTMKKFESIRIKDGAVTLKSKAQPASP